MTLASSKRRLILEALIALIGGISVHGGYRTDAGAQVFLNEAPQLGPDDPDVAVALVLGDDQAVTHGSKVFIELPIEFQALAKADIDAPYLAIEDVLADLKQAIEVEDRTLGGLVAGELGRGQTVTIPREPGTTTVGVSLTYQVPYRERWGHPED